MSGIPSLTILSEEQKFNGENLLQWKTNIIQLLGSKGLSGYIDGKIQRPTQTELPKATSEETSVTEGTTATEGTTTTTSVTTPATVPTIPVAMPIYSSTPS